MKFDPKKILSTPRPIPLFLARRGLGISDETAQLRVNTALHEAAHLVAAKACNSGIYSVQIFLKAPKRGCVFGRVESLEIPGEAEYFVPLVGYAWELLYGDVNTAANDLKNGIHASYPCTLGRALKFVADHKQVIEHAAVGILALCNKQGRLEGNRLYDLLDWLKPQITPYVVDETLRVDPPEEERTQADLVVDNFIDELFAAA